MADQSKRLHWFTLVELIVVITILVILGTIAFLNFAGYSVSARDSARISNLTNLQKGLSIFQTKSGTYPMPESAVNITASGTTIGYQGFAKDTVGWIAGISKWGTVDPADSSIYTTYSINSAQNKMQLMAFLEDGSNVTAYIPSTYASASSDYTKRTPSTKGDQVGILLGMAGAMLNQPIQETGTGVDVVNTQTGYIAFFTKKVIDNGTGAHLMDAFLALSAIYNANSYNWHSVDSNCWKPDVVIGSQIWAGCNSTIGSTGTGYGQTSCSDYAGGAKTCTPAPTGKTVSTMTEADYQTGQSSNMFGALYRYDSLSWSIVTWSTTGNCLGKWLPSGDASCPCKAGYHVPTQAEWDALEVALGCSGGEKLVGDITGWECTISSMTDTLRGLGWTSNNPGSLRNRLGLPLAGYWDSSLYLSRGFSANYWTASVYTPGPTYAWRRGINTNTSSVARFELPQSAALSVRCMRD